MPSCRLQRLMDSFGDKRHEWMPEAKYHIEDGAEYRIILLYFVDLNIPVGEFTPGEVSELLAGE